MVDRRYVEIGATRRRTFRELRERRYDTMGRRRRGWMATSSLKSTWRPLRA